MLHACAEVCERELASGTRTVGYYGLFKARDAASKIGPLSLGTTGGNTWMFSALPSVTVVAVTVTPSWGPFPALSYKFLLGKQP